MISIIRPGGLLDRWNQSNPDKVVKPGDRIVSVNGVQGKFWPMMIEFDGEGIFRVVMLRGALEDYISLSEYRAAQESQNRSLPPKLLDLFPTGRAEDFADWSMIAARFSGGAHDCCSSAWRTSRLMQRYCACPADTSCISAVRNNGSLRARGSVRFVARPARPCTLT